MKTSTWLIIGGVAVLAYYLYSRGQGTTAAQPAPSAAPSASPSIAAQIGSAVGGYVGDQAASLLAGGNSNSDGYNS